jgi:6,7-dimethyl-8-ribityllumazine synthase
MKTQQIAIVVSQFNPEITSLMAEGARARCEELGLTSAHYLFVEVPGVVEIPLIVKQLALKKSYQAIVALGAVIRGDTDHYDYVCDQVSYGCQKVALETQTPVIFGVLTCDTDQQAFERLGGSEGNKAKDAIDTALIMIERMREISHL